VDGRFNNFGSHKFEGFEFNISCCFLGMGGAVNMFGLSLYVGFGLGTF